MKGRKILLLALVVGIGYWIYRTRPTVSGIVDDLTRPIFGSKAAVKESEHKRVEAEAAPAVGRDESVSVGTLKEGMKADEVRDLVGRPDEIEQFKENGVEKVRWTYRRIGRVLVLREGRVVSIEIR
ncbi:MAG TPA: hypothetical protein VEO37_03145 [Thermoanaerobaculia bacterium]|nr:hypothetical protein [Thermoanaerobaculia bacterium]